MKDDKMNFSSDDLQKTMEVPAVGGNNKPPEDLFDPWHLNSGGPSDSILESIKKSLENADKIPEVISIPFGNQPAEEVQPVIEEPAQEPDPVTREEPDQAVEEPRMPEEDVDVFATQVIKKVDTPEFPEDLPADATIVIPAVKAEDEPETSEKQINQPEVISRKSGGARIWPPVLISSVVLIVACFITLVSAIMPVLTEHGIVRGMTQIMAPVISAGEPMPYTNVLLVGVDEDGYRTDTMMVATYDVDTNNVYVMQLPRDTYVTSAQRKLNAAYYFGIDQLKQEVQVAYGVEVHKYVEINLESFRKMIDAIGGVETVVPFNMIYDDPTQDFHIYLIAKKDANGNPVAQLLDGKKAEQFVRFRKNNDGSGYARGDLQRMEVQRQFLKDTVKQMISIDGLKNIDELIKIAQENIETDLTAEEIYNYCVAVFTAENGEIEFVDAPGEAMTLSFGSYFIVDYDKAREIAQEKFYATQATMSKMKRVVFQPVETTPEAEDEDAEGEDEEKPTASKKPSKPSTDGGGSSAVTRDDDDDDDKPSVTTKPDNEETTTGSGAMSR